MCCAVLRIADVFVRATYATYRYWKVELQINCAKVRNICVDFSTFGFHFYAGSCMLQLLVLFSI